MQIDIEIEKLAKLMVPNMMKKHRHRSQGSPKSRKMEAAPSPQEATNAKL